MGCRQSTPVAAPASSSPSNTPAPQSTAPASAPQSKSSNAAPSAPASETLAVETEAPKSTAPAEPKPVSPLASAGRFVISDHSIVESGVVYYTIELAGDASGAAVRKRFREFKALYQALHRLEGGATLPALPDSGLRSVLKGRHNEELLKAREVQLAAVLNAIADRPTLVATSEFRQFVAPASA